MERVVTVHGVSSDGPWQEMLRFLLYPFFECTSIKYRHYRRFGAIKLVLDPWVLVVGLIAMFLLRRLSLLRGLLGWACAWTLLLGVGHLLAFLRRMRAFTAYMNQLNAFLIAGARPHLIAHSFGTYLAGRALEKWPALRFRRIILTGCVLSSRYNWSALNGGQRHACVAVRNEIAKKDAIARVAFLLQGLLPGMGHAGFSGFADPPNVVHNVKSPYECCPACRAGASALVHNVEHPEFGHSDQFITSLHAESFWLPFLWSMEPSEYQEFLDLCHEAAELEESHDDFKLAVVEAELRERPWRWALGSLSHYLRQRLEGALQNCPEHRLEDAVDRGVGLLWRSVRTAARVRDRTLSTYLSGSDRDRRFLEPSAVVTADDRDQLMALRPEFAALRVLRALLQDLRG